MAKVSKIEGLLAYLHAMKLLSKTAFICNILFLVCVLVQHTHDFVQQKDLTSIVVILGWMISPFLNIGYHIAYLISWVLKKQAFLPLWLVICNLLILFIQVYIYIFATS